YEAMRDLADKGDPIDILSLSERLVAKAALERAGGRAYLAELANSAPAPGNYSHYAELVAKKHVMRALIDTAHEITESAYDETQDTAELLDQAEKSIYAIGNASAAHKFTSISDKLDAAWDRIETLSKHDGAIR